MLMAIFLEVVRIFSVALVSILAVRSVVHPGDSLGASVELSEILSTDLVFIVCWDHRWPRPSTHVFSLTWLLLIKHIRYQIIWELQYARWAEFPGA